MASHRRIARRRSPKHDGCLTLNPIARHGSHHFRLGVREKGKSFSFTRRFARKMGQVIAMADSPEDIYSPLYVRRLFNEMAAAYGVVNLV
jgi:hypothetical protein